MLKTQTFELVGAKLNALAPKARSFIMHWVLVTEPHVAEIIRDPHNFFAARTVGSCRGTLKKPITEIQTLIAQFILFSL